MTGEPVSPDGPPPRRGLPMPLALVLSGLAWWPIAFLPWLIGRSADIPEPDRHHTPVPLLANQGPLLVSCVLVGGLLSALLLRFCRGALLRRLLLGAGGLLVVMLAVCAVAGPNSREIATDSVSQSRAVGVGLMAILIMATGLVWLVGLLALVGRTGWVVPVTGLAAAMPDWLSGLGGHEVPFGGWLAGALIGVSLAVGAVRSLVAVLWWITALGVAWIVGPLVTAAVYSQQLIPGLTRRGDLVHQLLAEVVAPCLQVFGLAAAPGNRPLLPWALALALGLVGLIIGVVRRRRLRMSVARRG